MNKEHFLAEYLILFEPEGKIREKKNKFIVHGLDIFMDN